MTEIYEILCSGCGRMVEVDLEPGKPQMMTCPVCGKTTEVELDE